MTDAIERPSEEIDVEELNRRYAEERAKRLRTDGSNQYAELNGRYANFDRDPFADPDFTRDPIVEDVDVLIIGGGFGGLLAGGRLREPGIEDLRIVEKGADFGGTWYWNRYPGAACDVEAYIYLPMLEETGYVPTEKYAKGAGDLTRIARSSREHFDLYRAGAVPDRGQRAAAGTRTRARWIVHTEPRRRSRRASSSRATRLHRASRSCPASPASRASRAKLPHQPLGL